MVHCPLHPGHLCMCEGLVFVYQAVGQDEECSVFGADFARGQESQERGLWLNFDTPALCNGTAVQWHFCYYVLYSNHTETHELQLRIYRDTASQGKYKKIIEDVVSREYMNKDDLNKYGAVCDEGSPPYCCETLAVNHSIHENDIIGVCMGLSATNIPLDEAAPTNYTHYLMVEDECDMGHESGSFQLELLKTKLTGFGLHVYLMFTGESGL